MMSALENMGLRIRSVLDCFYPPFSKFVSFQVFLYGITGVLNIIFDWILYFVLYNFVVAQNNLRVGIVTLSPHIAALFITFPISFLSGFLLQKYVTFNASELKGLTQLGRYLVVVLLNLGINYGCMKFFVDYLRFYPTPSKMIATMVCTAVSYIGQKKFTFRV